MLRLLTLRQQTGQILLPRRHWITNIAHKTGIKCRNKRDRNTNSKGHLTEDRGTDPNPENLDSFSFISFILICFDEYQQLRSRSGRRTWHGNNCCSDLEILLPGGSSGKGRAHHFIFDVQDLKGKKLKLLWCFFVKEEYKLTNTS